MRIQHNIMAMNAYRNYTNNTSALSKNLEKLSSGYKINRAGDDAAGLAISEKMRAQITGLETAQKNAKDGISLVKTAEGALTEVHDMLNRMVTLATQSANGTYDNETDRAQLQKEMDQLSSEIDRIADSSNFNGIKLLDGSMEGDTTAVKVSYGGKGDLTIVGAADTKGSTNNVTTTPTAAAPGNTVAHKDATAFQTTKFEVNLRNLEYTASSSGASDTLTLSVTGASGAGATTIEIKTTGDMTAEDIAAKFEAKAAETDGIAFNGVTYTVKADGDRLIFEMDEESALKLTATDISKFQAPSDVSLTKTGDGDLANDRADFGIENAREGAPNVGAILASTTTAAAIGDGDIKDGCGYIIGGESYVFALTDVTYNTNFGNGVKVIDIRDLADTNGGFDKNKANGVDTVLTRLTEAAKDNKMFHVGVTNDKKLTFWEKESYDGDADLTTGKAIQKQIKKFTKATAKEVTTRTTGGKPLTLQIGDTAESFNQLKVNINDCHVAALGIKDISIADQDSAAAAIDKIKSAINYVSDVRGTLGATQNRLDHTINNLGVMTENIQDAESTIRDVDVAEEMMAYTKNNILVQSAQAMLAQANQIPQGVLQLLG